MKTIEAKKTAKAMKTTNFRKAAMRSAAVVVSFVLVSITVSAQEFWKKVLTHSSFNEIALALVESPEKEAPANENTESAFWVAFDKAFDPALELEGWMTSENYFGTTTFGLEPQADVPLKIENWMLDKNLFSSREVQEKLLELENWMTSADFWAL
jgi:predicted naringenin-chalcone synthase